MNPLETVRGKIAPWSILGELSGLKDLGDVFGHDFIENEIDVVTQKVLHFNSEIKENSDGKSKNGTFKESHEKIQEGNDQRDIYEIPIDVQKIKVRDDLMYNDNEKTKNDVSIDRYSECLFSCNICRPGKKFYSKALVATHMKTAHGISLKQYEKQGGSSIIYKINHTCHFCAETFLWDRSIINSHMYRVHNKMYISEYFKKFIDNFDDDTEWLNKISLRCKECSFKQMFRTKSRVALWKHVEKVHNKTEMEYRLIHWSMYSPVLPESHTCQICFSQINWESISLKPHIELKHGMTVSQYINKFKHRYNKKEDITVEKNEDNITSDVPETKPSDEIVNVSIKSAPTSVITEINIKSEKLDLVLQSPSKLDLTKTLTINSGIPQNEISTDFHNENKDLSVQGTGRRARRSSLKCFKCSKICEGSTNLKHHIISHFNHVFTDVPKQPPYNCPECEKPSRDRISAIRHFALSHKKIFQRTEVTQEHFKCQIGPPTLKGEIDLEILNGEIEPPTLKGEIEPPTIKGEIDPPTLKDEIDPPTLKGKIDLEILKGEIEPPTLKGQIDPETSEGEIDPVTVKGKIVHACKICPIKFKTKVLLEKHIKWHGIFENLGYGKDNKRNNDSIKIYTCKICPKKFKDVRFLNVHMKNHGVPRHPMKYNNVVRGKDNKIKITEVNNDKNMDNTNKTIFNCKMCPKMFKNKIFLNMHIKHMHINKNIYSCKICRATCKDKELLELHMKHHNIDYENRASGKKKINKTAKDESLENKKSNISKDMFSCEKCPLPNSFFSKAGLQMHMKTPHRMENIENNVINESTKQSDNSSLNIPHGKPVKSGKYSCELCKTNFISSSFWLIHMRKKHLRVG